MINETPALEKRLLVVDDEETLCEALSLNLEAEGYRVDVAYSAEEALTLSLADYDLILLDIMMGDISGIQFAKIVKSNPHTASVPIIFCTAKDSEEEMISGLELGADDYITKPYSIRTVLARVRTVLRRIDQTKGVARNPEPDMIKFEGLTLLPNKKICLVDGNEVKMPKKEFEILFKLLSNIDRVFTREELLKEIWPDEVIVLDRVIDVNITRIRQKIGEYGNHIVTRSGYGYGFMV